MRPDSEFISGKQARRIVGGSIYAVLKAAAVGKVRARETASGLVIFHRQDVLRLAHRQASA